MAKLNLFSIYSHIAGSDAPVISSGNLNHVPLPDKPSIAVLPFVNMSGDPKKEYLSDGITENLISVLSALPNLFVIAGNSSFAEKGISLVPNGANAHAWLAMSLTMAGRAQEALPLFEKAMRLNPLPPAFYFLWFGHSYRILNRLEEAIAMYKKTIALTPDNIFAYVCLAGSCAMIAKEEEAHTAAKEVLRINPKFSAEQFMKISTMADSAAKVRFSQALRKAGLPE